MFIDYHQEQWPEWLGTAEFAYNNKVQEDMRRYADRHRVEAVEYKVGDLMLLSTKDLKWQMVGRCSEKLTEQFVGPYKIKAIIVMNCQFRPLTSYHS